MSHTIESEGGVQAEVPVPDGFGLSSQREEFKRIAALLPQAEFVWAANIVIASEERQQVPFSTQVTDDMFWFPVDTAREVCDVAARDDFAFGPSEDLPDGYAVFHSTEGHNVSFYDMMLSGENLILDTERSRHCHRPSAMHCRSETTGAESIPSLRADMASPWKTPTAWHNHYIEVLT